MDNGKGKLVMKIKELDLSRIKIINCQLKIKWQPFTNVIYKQNIKKKLAYTNQI